MKADFFVGYLKPLPHARRVWAAAGVLAAAAITVAVGVSATMHGPGSGVWSVEERTLTGVLVLEPCPMVVVPGESGPRAVMLVSPGKCGLMEGPWCGPSPSEAAHAPARTRERHELLSSLAGRVVRVRGTMIEREGHAVMEVADTPDFVVEAGTEAGVAAPEVRELGPVSITGEIVDPKCFLGAMKPGHGKVHRACAVRCLSGGIPPAVASRDASGRLTVTVIADPDGKRMPAPDAAGTPGARLAASVFAAVGDVVTVSGDGFEIGGVRCVRLGAPIAAP